MSIIDILHCFSYIGEYSSNTLAAFDIPNKLLSNLM